MHLICIVWFPQNGSHLMTPVDSKLRKPQSSNLKVAPPLAALPILTSQSIILFFYFSISGTPGGVHQLIT